MGKKSLDSIIGKVADEFTERLNRGEHPEVEEYAERHPEVADLLRGILPALEVLRQDAKGSERAGASTSPSATPKGCLGDFRIIREIGRGGMGIVYEAEQISLLRRVALKVLPFAASWDEKRLQRFQHEAQAAAHLHHTNIVPVFGIGCERGVHFYAMQYIAGTSLASVIGELRHLSGLPIKGTVPPEAVSAVSGSFMSGEWVKPATLPPAAPVEPGAETLPQCQDTLSVARATGQPNFFRTVARLGTQAAAALEYAHTRGVVHRDIKPANLLVDEHGDVWITDFGMAQFRSDGELTQSGDLLGTVRYMSPEQALGKRELVDGRTDIYSLGVTLFELLTLEPAYPGTDREQILHRVTSDHLPTLPDRCRQFPAELWTILTKAMAKAPEERYLSAKELAEDLQRFLEDRPILARRPTLVHKVRKWSRRHKTGVTVGLAALAAGLAASTALVWWEMERIDMAYQAESKLRRRAEAREQLARRAVDEMYTQVAEKWLATAPRMTELQLDFIRKALAFYQELIQENDTDPSARYKTAETYHFLGRIQARMGQNAEAERAFRHQITLLQELIREFPAEREYRFDLYHSLAQLAETFKGMGRDAEFDETNRSALEIIEKLANDFPGEPNYRDAMADQVIKLGQILLRRGEFQQAEYMFRRSLGIGEKLVQQFPDKKTPPHYPQKVAASLDMLASSLCLMGRWREAEKPAARAVQVGRKLASDQPEEPAFRYYLAGYEKHLAGCLGEQRRTREAMKLLDEALTLAEEYRRDFPSLPLGEVTIAEMHELRAHLCLIDGRYEQAERELRYSLGCLEKLEADQPASAHQKIALAQFLCNCPLPQLRNPKRAFQLLNQAAQLEPNHHLHDLIFGEASYRGGNWRAAVDALQKAQRLNSTSKTWEREHSAVARFFLAMAYWQLKEKEEARRYFEKAAQQMDQLFPNTSSYLRREAAELLGIKDSSLEKLPTILGKD
jgi:serine/threonine protein kinase